MSPEHSGGRIARLLAAGALAAGLSVFATPGAMASPATSASSGWLRLAHLSPNTPAVDVYLYALHNSSAMVVLHHVAYGTVSSYETVAAGSYVVAMRAAGAGSGTPPVLSTSINVAADHAYTVAGMGPKSGLRLQVLDDALTTPEGRSLVRVIQASLQQNRVTVTAGSQVLARNLAFGTLTSYQSVAPGTWTVSVTGPSKHATKSISLVADTSHTLVVLDDPGNLTVVNLTDAAGSNLMPSGSPGTGFGGMAPRPGSSPLPWVAMAAVGLLACAATGLRLRRAGTRGLGLRSVGLHSTAGRGRRSSGR
jgi:spore coat protein U-like protein